MSAARERRQPNVGSILRFRKAQLERLEDRRLLSVSAPWLEYAEPHRAAEAAPPFADVGKAGGFAAMAVQPVGQWDFDDPADLTQPTVGADLVLVGGDQAVAGVTPGDGAARLGVGDYYVAEHGIAPGGGSYVNEYSLLFDFQVPALGQWACFFQTNEANANDGDCFVRDPDGTIGVGSTGYSATAIEPGTWYRLVVVVDNGSRHDVYLDGAKILDGNPQSIDGRFSLGDTLLVCADENGEDNPMDLSSLAIFDHALADADVAELGGPYQPDPGNTPPEMVVAPAGPPSGQTQVEISFTFSAIDVDADAVQFRIDWGDGSISAWSQFQSTASSYDTSHVYNTNGTTSIRAEARDEHGASSGLTLIQTIEITGDVVVQFVTMPYLQNMTPESMVIMWEMDAAASLSVEYGWTDEYGESTPAASEASGYAGTHIFKAELTGLLPESQYHYRLVTDGDTPLTADRVFKTGTDEPIDFAFGTWGDSQGTNHGAWTADPLEPTTSMMAHMAQSGVDFGFAVGDLAESGSSYYDTSTYYLGRVADRLGQSVAWFNAWGNHDSSSPGAILRRFADMPSKDRPGYTPGYGSFYFTYADCLFIAIDYYDDNVITNGWLEDLLQSDLNRDARFTIVGVHVPPYCERWIDGSSSLRSNLVPLMEQYGVDVCISGHTHEYERGLQGGVNYVITGGGSWLDHPEPLVAEWPHMTVGGQHDLPGTWAQESSPGVLGTPQPIRGGLVNEYVRFEITGNHLTGELHAFNADGSYIGVLDTFAFGDTPGVNDPPAFADAVLVKAAAWSGAEYEDSLFGDATDPDLGDVLTFSQTSGLAWLDVAADGTLSGTPGLPDLGENAFTVRVTDVEGLFDEATLQITVERGFSSVVGCHVFYNNSAFDTGLGKTDDNAMDDNAMDDNAIAPDKSALLPGGQPTFENYTSYRRGINGIMVDIANPMGTITAADFALKVGNDDNPAGWSPYTVTPTVAVRPGQSAAEKTDFDRVSLIWPDHDPSSPETTAVAGQWLQVTVLANDNTALAEDYMFYFGNAIGETGDRPAESARVDAYDVLQTRNNPRPFFDAAALDSTHDFNRDQRVDAADILIARSHQTTFFSELKLWHPRDLVLITEAATGNPDYVEIQNVSAIEVDTSGWIVAVGDGPDVGSVQPTVWNLPDSMAAGDVLCQDDAGTDTAHWGDGISWATAGPGWVMILDEVGGVVDFVVWGYSTAEIASIDVDIHGYEGITVGHAWNGSAAQGEGTRTNSLQRRGNSDHDDASDWTFVESQSKGDQNDGLIVPFFGGAATGKNESAAGRPIAKTAPARDAVFSECGEQRAEGGEQRAEGGGRSAESIRPGRMAWLLDFVPERASNRSADRERSTDRAVDQLLRSEWR